MKIQITNYMNNNELKISLIIVNFVISFKYLNCNFIEWIDL